MEQWIFILEEVLCCWLKRTDGLRELKATACVHRAAQARPG
jgi:hypothetical protein